MKPILTYVYLFNHKFAISAYVSFGCLAALYLYIFAYRHLKREGVSTGKILITSFWVIISFFVGARLLYGILYIGKIIETPSRLFQIKLVGFALYGGLGGAVSTWYYICTRYKLDFFRITDAIVPHLGVSAAIAKLGCFFNGCCYGVATTMPWGVAFENADKNPFKNVFGNNPFTNILFNSPTILRHPAQLYEVFFALLSAVIAALLLRKKVKRGIASAVFLIIYSIGRFISFLFRDFPEATFVSNIIRGPVVYGGVVILCSLYIRRVTVTWKK